VNTRRSLSFYWRSYLRTALRFRNGLSLVWNHYWHRDVESAVFWSGERFRMPPRRAGLVDTVIEIWGSQVYTADGFYEPRQGDVILDVGANVGAFSLWAAAHAPGARIIAVEPSAENFAMLQHNIGGSRNHVLLYQLAIGGHRGKGRMVDGGARSIEHRLMADSGIGDVEVITLADLLTLADVRGEVDLLKMDIEGAEADVFADITPALLRRFRRIALEYHDNLRPGTLALVRERLAATHDIVWMDGTIEGYGNMRARRR